MAGQPKPKPAPLAPIKVRATMMVFYGACRRRPGTVFTLEKPDDFDPHCMVAVDAETPETQSTAFTEPLRGGVRNLRIDDDNPLGAE